MYSDGSKDILTFQSMLDEEEVSGELNTTLRYQILRRQRCGTFETFSLEESTVKCLILMKTEPGRLEDLDR